ncbi:hypothetical protein MSG28_005195, partial [Choristoneura fumiferana]
MDESVTVLDEAKADNLYPALFQCFTIILCGYIAGRLNVVSQTESKGIGTFVGTFALPSLIFLSLARLDFTTVNWTFLLAILLAKGIVFFSVMIVTIMVSKPVNLVNAIYENTHPEYALYLYLMAPISLAILNPVAFVLMEIKKQRDNAQIITTTPEGERQSDLCKFKLLRQIIKGIALNPVLVMTVLGIIGNIAFKHQLSIYIELLLKDSPTSSNERKCQRPPGRRQRVGDILVINLRIFIWNYSYCASSQVISINKDYADQMKKFGFHLSIVSLVVLVWVLTVFVVTKKYKRMPHRLTLFAASNKRRMGRTTSADRPVMVGAAPANFVHFQHSRGPCFVVTLWPVLGFVAWGAAGVMSAVLLATRPQSLQLDRKAIDAIRLAQFASLSTDLAADSPDETSGLVDNVEPVSNTQSVTQIASVKHRCGGSGPCQYLSELERAAGALGLLPPEQSRGRGGQLLKHTSITYTTWQMMRSDESGVFVEIEFLDIAATYGQALVIFVLFGLDPEEMLIPAVRYFKKQWHGADTVILPSIEDLSFETKHVCDQFIMHHLDRCKETIAKDTSCGLAKDEAEAVTYGKHLLDGRLISHVNNAHHFSNSPLLYTFKNILDSVIFKKWSNKYKILKLCELREKDTTCIIVGTLFKLQELKPSILKQLSDQLEIIPQPSRFLKKVLKMKMAYSRLRIFVGLAVTYKNHCLHLTPISGLFVSHSNEMTVTESNVISSVDSVDSFCAAVSSVAPLDIMPGCNDPAGVMLPQKPLHYCVFKFALSLTLSYTEVTLASSSEKLSNSLRMSASIWDWTLASADGLLTTEECSLLLETDLLDNDDILKTFPNAATKIESGEFHLQDDVSSLYPPSPPEAKPSRAELASDLLQQLENQCKQENIFSNWLEEKVDLPIFENITHAAEVVEPPLVYAALPAPGPQPTEELLREFESVYGAVELTHLTPPQSPPGPATQLLLSYAQQAQCAPLPAPAPAPAEPWAAPLPLPLAVPAEYDRELQVVEELVRHRASQLASPQPSGDSVSPRSSPPSSPRSSTDEEWSLPAGGGRPK